tara:strand:- start:3177 stop:3287 length:111 start_codon:yes stop_codon:yes gene_type:complete
MLEKFKDFWSGLKKSAKIAFVAIAVIILMIIWNAIF